MDTVLIEKLKQNFQTERREQVLKGKDLQKETMQRRRTMEMKAQLEAAKEEKRRQEALAERKARHIEATMRFQKGLKHFKFNKERISLEQVLKNIQPNQQNSHHHRARLNSADDTTDRSHFSNKDANSNYYSNSANKLNHLRKSSSFESLNSLLNNNYNSDLNINYTQNNNNNNNYMKPASSNKMIIEQMKLNNNNNNTNIQQHMNAYNPETLTENTNFKINRHHIQNIIYNDNKTNNNDVMSKENLKDFQNLVANELNFNKIIKINPKQHFYDTSNVLTVDDYRNGLYIKHDNKQEEDQVSTDSMETDSLVNLNLDGADNQTYKLTNKIDNSENDTNDEILFLNNNIKKKEPISNHLNSNYNSHIDASNLWFSSHTTLTNNNNKPKIKTTNQQKFQQQPVIKQPITVTHNIVNRNNSAGNIKENNNNNNNNNNISNNKEIKSILKRSTSLENNLTIGNFATSNQVKPASDNNIKNSGVKDSLDVANMRKIKNENEFNETNGKKSVRFATQLNDFNNNNDINKTEVFSQQPIENKISTQATLNLAQPTADDQNRISSTNSIRRPVIKSKNPILNGYNNKNKSIKSEVISNNGDIVTTTTIITSPKIMMNNHYKADDYTINSEKPPAHPNTTYNMMNSGGNSNTINGNSSYSIIGQKRREILQQRGKLNSGGSSSCSTTSGSGGSSGLLMNDRLLLNSPKQQQQQQNGVNIKIDVAPSPNTSNYSTPTILPLNRLSSLTSPSPISSPNQFFPIPISSSSQTSSSLTNNSSSNNNNNIYNNHFSNSKLIEGNYREYQLSKQNNGSVPSTPTSNNTNTMRLNNNTVIDMNLYKKLDISNYLDQQHQLNQIYNREYYSNNNNNNNNNNKHQSEYNQVLSKIPLSPKNSLKTYNDTIIKSPNINNHEQIILRRPTSEISNNTPNTMFTSKPPTPPNSFNATPTATFTQLMSPKIMQPQQQQQQNSNLNDVNKTNIRFAYINSPLSSNQTNFTANTTNLENQTNKNFNQKNQNTIHLEIKYPLYSNHPAQNTQYINIAKPISRQTSFESDPNNQKTIPVSISVEEQNVKNSIMRLNERLNMLQNHQRYTSNGDYLNGTNYDNLNKNKTNGRSITTNITKLRR